MKFAVIITVYKRYKYIKDAINSVLSQTVKPDQILIVADNPKMLNNSMNVTIIEADYPQYGKMIFEAIKALRDDIDIVYFLDDDDMFQKNKIEYINKIFEKRRDVVTVHNSKELVDESGNHLNLSYDIPFEVLIDRNKFRKINRQFPLGLGNNSAYSVRREFLDEIRTNLSNINLALDTALLYLSLEHNNLLLHIPEKLTIYRVGTGISAHYSKVIDYSKFLENKNKLVCTSNRYLEDFRYLGSLITSCKQCKKEIITSCKQCKKEIITSCKQCKKEIQRTILFLELYLSAENEVFKCDYKAQLPPLNSLFFLSIKHYLDGSISAKDLYNIIKGVLGQLILGKRRVSEIRSRKGY